MFALAQPGETWERIQKNRKMANLDGDVSVKLSAGTVWKLIALAWTVIVAVAWAGYYVNSAIISRIDTALEHQRVLEDTMERDHQGTEKEIDGLRNDLYNYIYSRQGMPENRGHR